MRVDADVAVVGLGAMGSMTLWRLAERGIAAIGIDRFAPPHDRGSSHGESRLIRTAYAEGAFYVPLLRDAWRLWRELETQSGVELLTETGALMIGPRGGGLVAQSLASARTHGLEHQLLDSSEAAARWPQHVLAADDEMLFETAAGVLRPEACIGAALNRARALGATRRDSTRVAAIDSDRGGVTLRLDGDDTVRARQCVVCAGAWTPALLPELAPHLRVERQVTAWFALDDAGAYSPARFPIFVRELTGGRLRYGVPAIDGRAIKLAVHHEGAVADPDALDRGVSDADLATLDAYAATMLRGVRPGAVRAIVCMYTNTPDEHLLIGPLSSRPGVIVAGGCSGHSFKLATALGDIAATLASGGTAPHDITRLAADRLVAEPSG
jgi:sarcosine oxidase